MNIDFDGKGKNKRGASMVEGSYEDMVKMRKKQLPEIKDEIQKMFKNYDGGLVAIITMDEDENGKSEGHSLFIGGVAHISTQLALGKALSEASEKMAEMLVDKASGNPHAMKSIVSELLEKMLDDITKDNERNK